MKKLEIKNILIDEKNYKDFVIYFARYAYKKSKKMLHLHYHELMGTIEEHEGKKYLMVDNNVLYEVLNKIKKIIGIGRFDDTKILIKTDHKLPGDVALKNFVILITRVISSKGKFHPKLFS